MARSACTSEDVNIQPACQLAAHACREHLIFTMNAFVILKKKKKPHVCKMFFSKTHHLAKSELIFIGVSQGSLSPLPSGICWYPALVNCL